MASWHEYTLTLAMIYKCRDVIKQRHTEVFSDQEQETEVKYAVAAGG